MKRILLTLMTVVFLSCHADFPKVSNMQQVFDHLHKADAKTLVIFDVDMVLVQPGNPAFQMANMKRFGAICKRILNEVPADKQMLFLSLMTIASAPVLIDDRVPQFLQQIQAQGITAMALTANLTGPLGTIPDMAEWRVEGLRQLGIDFSKTAPYQKQLLFDNLASYRGHYSTYCSGILFVNGTTISKGEAFLAFLTILEYCPNRIIFIDDREDNLKSMEAALLGRSIEYLGLHFQGAQNYPSTLISEEEFTFQWQQLASQVKEYY